MDFQHKLVIIHLIKEKKKVIYQMNKELNQIIIMELVMEDMMNQMVEDDIKMEMVATIEIIHQILNLVVLILKMIKDYLITVILKMEL